jgi:hypothetical protein
MALPPASSIFHVDSRICAPRNRTTNSSDIALSDLGTIRTSGEPICRDTRLLDGEGRMQPVVTSSQLVLHTPNGG